jgi:putative peptide zinc metalloprotease protein
MYASLGGLVLIVAAFLYLPLPYHIIASLETRVLDAKTVFVTVPGKLEEIGVRLGDRVQAGDVLAQLSSVPLELEISKLEGQRAVAQQHLQNLKRLGHEDSRAHSRIDEALKSLGATEKQLEEKRQDQERLRLKAPRDGIVLPPPWTPNRDDPAGRLSNWYGTPFEPQNMGCYLEPGSKFCLVGNPEQMEAVLVIDQADIDFVASGQEVEIKVDELPFETFPGKIEKIAEEEMEVSPRRMSAKQGGELSTKTDPETGVERPMSTSYYASVHLPDPEDRFRIGLRGRAKVHVRPQTLGQRVWRFLTRTFNFKL